VTILAALKRQLASLTSEDRRKTILEHAAELKARARQPRKMDAAMHAESLRDAQWVVQRLRRPFPNIPVKMPSGRLVMPDETLTPEEFERELMPADDVTAPASAPVSRTELPTVDAEPEIKPPDVVKRIVNRARSKPRPPEGLEDYADGIPLLYINGIRRPSI
jgi:hypothetical protein